jgi:hypothetical protein
MPRMQKALFQTFNRYFVIENSLRKTSSKYARFEQGLGPEDEIMEDAEVLMHAVPSGSGSASLELSSTIMPPEPTLKKRNGCSQMALNPRRSDPKKLLQALALFPVRNGIAHRVVETPEFQACLEAAGWKHGMPTRIGLRQTVIVKLWICAGS